MAIDKFKRKVKKQAKRYGKYNSRSFKNFIKHPNAYTLVAAITAPTGKTVQGVANDILSYFVPGTARQIRKVLNENAGADAETIIQLLGEAGIKQGDYNNAAAKASDNLYKTSNLASSAATWDKKDQAVSSARKRYNEASIKALKYANATLPATSELSGGLTGDTDISKTYNKYSKIIKEN